MRHEEVSYYCDNCKKTIVEHGEENLFGDKYIIYRLKEAEHYTYYCSEECLFQGITSELKLDNDILEIYRNIIHLRQRKKKKEGE